MAVSAQKIKKRDLDPEVFLYIDDTYRDKASPIGYDDLDPEVRAKILAGPTGSVLYDDTNLRNRVTALENNKADRSQLAGYMPIDQIIPRTQLTQDVRDDLDKIQTKADKSDLDNYIKKSNKIEESQLSSDLINKINTRYVNNGGALTDTVTRAQFTALQDRVTTAEVEIDDIQGSLANYRLKSKLIGQADLAESINYKIEHARQDTVKITKDDLDSYLAGEISKISNLSGTIEFQNKIQTLENKLQGPNGHVAFYNNVSIEPKTTVVFAFPVETLDEYNKALAYRDENNERTKYIVDLTNNERVYYLANPGDTSYSIAKMDDGSGNIVDCPASIYFSGQLLFNPITKKLFYAIPGYATEKLYEYVQPPATKKVVVNIAAGGSYTIDLTTLFPGKTTDDIVAKVTAKDIIAGSRTYGKYINSEAVATVCYNNTSITVYNDADTALDFKITMIG